MKKTLSGSSLLFVLFFSLIAFHLSCSKSEANVESSEAQEEIQTDNNPGGGGGGNNPSSILYLTMDYNTGDPQLRSIEMDGTNDHQINVVLPPNWYLLIHSSYARFAPKEQRIVFTAYQLLDGAPDHTGIFSCKLDGSDLVLIQDITLPEESSSAELWLQDVH